MAPSQTPASMLPFKVKNKAKRQQLHQKHKKSSESAKRDERFRRKREEDKNPRLRAERRARNIPATIDRKRIWDEVDADDGGALGYSVDVGQLKRQKLDLENQDQEPHSKQADDRDGLTQSRLKLIDEQDASTGSEDGDGMEEDLASIMNETSDEDDEDATSTAEDAGKPAPRAPSPVASVASTNMSLIPEALQAKFPTLFQSPEEPKILVTTGFNCTIHKEAELFTKLFPNSTYVPRQRHRYKSHHFSIREICKFATNRSFTTLLVIGEDLKRPSSLTVVHLPAGPTFHFSISNWIEGKKLPGHGNPTGHDPELILNNFRTPLGLLTAHLFRTMFPPQPEIEGRQVVTLHNQRDYIFVRRHRYVFRDKRATEKQVVGSDGKPMKGAEDIRAGLQELGPRFTLKLRRVDKGIQRGSGQEWEWKARMEKQRTKFQL